SELPLRPNNDIFPRKLLRQNGARFSRKARNGPGKAHAMGWRLGHPAWTSRGGIKIWTFRPLCQCGAAQSVDISGKSGEWRVPFRAKRDLIGRHSAKATARTRQVVLPHHKAHWPASGTRGAGPDKN